MISVSQLTKAYGPVLAVDRISFDVPKGQIVGFLGPNGAGKSTTIRMLSCYLAPTSGTATVSGFDIFHQSAEVRSKLGYLPENCPLYTEMKVREYLDFRGRLRKMPRDRRRSRIDYVVERCYLAEFDRRVIGHLSKGQRQRVGLADALLHDPPVLILDEPTVGLDPAQIIQIRKLIRDLGGQHTVMLSTHILPEVEAVCDRAIIIAGGRIVAQGSPDELRTSRRMSARVLVECKAAPDQLRKTLGHVAGVRQVEILIDGEPAGDSGARPRSNGGKASSDGFVTAAISATGGRDVREEVARTIAQHQWPLREIRLEQSTLEEYFVQVTAQQAMKST